MFAGVITSLVTSILTAAVSFMGGWLISEARKQQGKDEAIKNALLALLRASLTADFQRFAERGEHYTPEAFENDRRMFEAYSTLGGNGGVAEMWQRMKELKLWTA